MIESQVAKKENLSLRQIFVTGKNISALSSTKIDGGLFQEDVMMKYHSMTKKLYQRNLYHRKKKVARQV
jgi:hypothetical protein